MTRVWLSWSTAWTLPSQIPSKLISPKDTKTQARCSPPSTHSPQKISKKIPLWYLRFSPSFHQWPSWALPPQRDRFCFLSIPLVCYPQNAGVFVLAISWPHRGKIHQKYRRWPTLHLPDKSSCKQRFCISNGLRCPKAPSGKTCPYGSLL